MHGQQNVKQLLNVWRKYVEVPGDYVGKEIRRIKGKYPENHFCVS